MPSFDIVSEIDIQEFDNAINMVKKEMAGRFDFRGTKSSVDFDKQAKVIKIMADDELKMRSIHTMIEQRMAKRSIDIRCIDYQKEEVATGNMLRQIANLKAGLEKETAKKITKLIKDAKLKVNAEIQDDQVRVTGKKIDDLQEVMARLKQESLGVPLQFVNMRS